MKFSLCVSMAAGLAASAPAVAQLYDNGPFITQPPGACVPAGSQSSLLQNGAPPAGQGLTVNGFGNQYAGGGGNALADDFTVPSSVPGWRIDTLSFFNYMSGNSQTSPSPFTGLYVQIWDGLPGQAGSNLLFGDLSTNRLAPGSTFVAYRHSNTCGVTRPVFRNSATIGLTLPPGTYWVQWMTDGSLGTTSGPWSPPVTIIGQTGKAGANALQNGAPVLDGTFPQDFPFIIDGAVQTPGTGACCFLDGTCQQLGIVACISASGSYRGDNVTCGAANCPQPGACCNADGTCQILAASQCTAANQIYQGNGSTCAAANCGATGACCQLDNTCSVGTAAACQASNGIYKGNGVTCAASACPTAFAYAGSPVFIQDATGQNGTFCGAEAIAEINVPNAITVGAVDVSMFITHEWQGDLVFTLTHVPSNTSVEFYNRVPFNSGGSYDANNFGASPNPTDMYRVIESAANFYRSPPVPAGGIANVRGHWKPDVALTPFAGINGQGVWRLRVKDCGGPGDIGNVESWILSLHAPSAPACYANCDGSTQAPVLNVQDFSCFLTRYAAGESYANCDSSTQPPVLNVQDFSCFLTKYASGC